MSRIPLLRDDEAGPEMAAELARITAAQGRVTNMKRTAARSPAALRMLMEWYPLRDETARFLGARATNLFVHAISSATDCLICSTYFRRILIESGEDPDRLELDARETAIVEFARQLVKDSNAVSDALFAKLSAFLTPDQLVTLAAFGAVMVATNIFNNALSIPLDEYLLPYRKESPR